jgi:hypothetical protein
MRTLFLSCLLSCTLVLPPVVNAHPLSNSETSLTLRVSEKPTRTKMKKGKELFTIKGQILNPTSEQQTVPDILAEIKDAQGRIIYGWTISPKPRTIPAKGSIDFNSAEVNVPKGAVNLNLSFSQTAKK